MLRNEDMWNQIVSEYQITHINHTLVKSEIESVL